MLSNLAAAWVNQGNITAALMTLRQAAQLEPRNGKVYLQIGEILRYQNDIDGAIDAYQRALSVQPNLVEAQEAMSDILKQKKL